MRFLLFSLLLILIFSCINHSKSKIPINDKLTKIDSVFTNEEVADLIKSYDTYLKNLKVGRLDSLKPNWCKFIFDSVSIEKAFYKADFDNNGYTDLLVSGRNNRLIMLGIMSFGQNDFKTYNFLNQATQTCVIPKVRTENGKDLIDLYANRGTWNYHAKGNRSKMEIKTLTYRFNNFIEYNPNPIDNKIEKIHFSASRCYGTCPRFDLTINGDTTANLNAIKYNKKWSKAPTEMRGIFHTTLNTANFEYVMNVLNYLDFPNLEKGYRALGTDQSGVKLTITYDNGKVKTISDYGKKGTLGLRYLYGVLFDLRFNQDWIKSE